MFVFLTGLAIGLVVGWNVLPQPTWFRDFYTRAEAKIKSMF